MNLKDLSNAVGDAEGYDRDEIEELPLVVETPSGERLAVVGLTLQHDKRVLLKTAGAAELGLEERPASATAS